MLLAIEVGNSNTLCGLYEHGRPTLRSSFRLSTDRDRMPDEWLAMLAALIDSDGLRLDEIDSVVLSSVVPSVTTGQSDPQMQRSGPKASSTTSIRGVRVS